MEMDIELIGSRVRAARKMQDMTADELCEKIGIAPQTMRHIESGANKTSLQTLLNIADVLGVSTDYLLGRTSAPHEVIKIDPEKIRNLSEHQANMLYAMIENIVPVITDFVEK